MDDDDRIFKALADPTRRYLLDRLFERDGRTLTELESELEMTRFGVMKHLRLLEEAGLVVTRRSAPLESACPLRFEPASGVLLGSGCGLLMSSVLLLGLVRSAPGWVCG